MKIYPEKHIPVWVMILMEQEFELPDSPECTAFLVEKGIGTDRLMEIMKAAEQERASGKRVLVAYRNKNARFQKEQLGNQGYTDIREFFIDK